LYNEKNKARTSIDPRTILRKAELENQMRLQNTCVINQLGLNRSETVAYHRLMNNDTIQPNTFIKEMQNSVELLVDGKHVLVINDTTEINYQKHSGFLSKEDADLGPLGNNKDIGYFLHPSLVIDSATHMPLGFSSIIQWNRRWDKESKTKRCYQQQNITDKESQRWLSSVEETKQSLSLAAQITVIADRESDIYEEFATVPDERTHLLIRSSYNRSLLDGRTLESVLASEPITHRYDLKVRGTKQRKARETKIQIKYTSVKIKKPSNLSKRKKIAEYVELTIVEAREEAAFVPLGEKPIYWRILTTHTICNGLEALQIIQWYAMRWHIELVFYTLKTGCLNVELSELETGKALKNMGLMALKTALIIHQLKQSRIDATETEASLVFTAEALIVIKACIPQYEGKTEKQKNPFKENTLAWAAWLIARLGGWNGYQKESPPGVKTFKRGLDIFYNIYEGYFIAKKLCA